MEKLKGSLFFAGFVAARHAAQFGGKVIQEDYIPQGENVANRC